MNNINKVQKYTKPIYSKEIRLMFTNIICDIESLQDKIITYSQQGDLISRTKLGIPRRQYQSPNFKSHIPTEQKIGK